MLERILELANSIAHDFDLLVQLLCICEDEADDRDTRGGYQQPGSGGKAIKRLREETDRLPFPPVSAPSGQISAHPRLQHDWHGKTRSHWSANAC